MQHGLRNCRQQPLPLGPRRALAPPGEGAFQCHIYVEGLRALLGARDADGIELQGRDGGVGRAGAAIVRLSER